MAFENEFVPLTVEEVPKLAADMKADGWRFVQIMCVNTEDGLDMIYSFMKDGLLSNHEIRGIQKGTTVPSITDTFLEAFFFENESHELFGVDISDIALDFQGNFYTLAQDEPMTIISPEQKAAREKAKKVAAAKAAKEKRDKEGGSEKKQKKASMDQAEMEEKLAGMDPEKAAKVRAAMEAKAKKEAKKEAEAKEAKAREKMKDLDPEKAAKVQAALDAKKAREAAAEQKTPDDAPANKAAAKEVAPLKEAAESAADVPKEKPESTEKEGE